MSRLIQDNAQTVSWHLRYRQVELISHQLRHEDGKGALHRDAHGALSAALSPPRLLIALAGKPSE